MEPTVLAGAIEFSPVDIAAIIAVLAALFVAVTSPGWLVLALVAGRRPGPAATPRRRWMMRAAGGLAGIGISAAMAALLGAMGDQGFFVGILAGWAACWALAARLRKRSATPSTTTPQGWGR
jgi:hypothetical protein